MKSKLKKRISLPLEINPSLVKRFSGEKALLLFILFFLTCFALAGCALNFTPSPIPPAFPTQATILPLSGFELDFEPSLWNDQGSIQQSTNCYAYALDRRLGFNVGDKLQPGSLSGQSLSSSSEIEVEKIIELVEADADEEGFEFESASANEACPEGTYKVALVVDPQVDYHWYRQDSDGEWSHKPGHAEVNNVDASDNVISDPKDADRDYGSVNYIEFGGYFCTGSN